MRRITFYREPAQEERGREDVGKTHGNFAFRRHTHPFVSFLERGRKNSASLPIDSSAAAISSVRFSSYYTTETRRIRGMVCPIHLPASSLSINQLTLQSTKKDDSSSDSFEMGEITVQVPTVPVFSSTSLLLISCSPSRTCLLTA